MIRIILSLIFGAVVSQAATTFTYSLAKAGTTSAGIYANDTLIRTLWFNVSEKAGMHTNTWDNKDDDGNVVAPGDYEIRVLTHHMRYDWDGLVGNSSAEMTGTTVHKGMAPLQDMAITGTKAYYTTGYNEAHYPFARFDTRQPQARLHSWAWVVDTRSPGSRPLLNDNSCPPFAYVATDGTHVYFASTRGFSSMTSYVPTAGYIIANRVSDDGQPEDVFAHGATMPDPCTPPYAFPFGIRVGTQPGLSGLAVQPTGRLLAVAVAPDNRVYLVDKLSGDPLGSWAVANPKRIAFEANGNNLWVAAGANVYCYRVPATAPYTATLTQTIPGFANALAVAPSPIADQIVVADGGASMQLKAFTAAGAPLWVHGQAGGYQRNGPAVTDDKFWFFGTPNKTITPTRDDTFIAFAPDGTFWVGDQMNARTLHFSAGRRPRLLDQISMQPMSYCIAVDQHDPRRVFRNFLEFKVDYRKPLGPANGSWTLVNNWAASLPSWSGAASADDSNAGLRDVITLKNGRTYAYLYHHELDTNGVSVVKGQEIVELTATGLRPTGQIAVGALLEDGSRYRPAPNESNGSFETGDHRGWITWTSGPPQSWSVTAQRAPHQATDGDWYVRLQTTGATNGGTVAVSLGWGGSVIFSPGHTFTLSFDLQNQTNGFDLVAIELLSVDSKGQVAASVSPPVPPALQPDGRWHSYTINLPLPARRTESALQLRMSFLKGGAVVSNTYEANLDNIQLTHGVGNVVIDRGMQYWYRAPLSGFDAQGNPHWGPESVVASVYQLPGSSRPVIGFSGLSSRGVIVCYEPSLRNIRHLAGIRLGETNWAWQSFPSTNTDFHTVMSYPKGYYDLGNFVVSGGTLARVSGRHIIACFNGEAWHASQANQYLHFYDDGLLIGQFGTSGTDAQGRRWPKDSSMAGYAGNAYSATLAKSGEELYLYLNDEWGASLQRCHLSGANDIRELTGTGPLDGTIKLSPIQPNPHRKRTQSK